MNVSALDLTPEERMQLVDMVQSDAWQTVKKISDYHYQNCLELLLGVSEGSDFRHTQGIAHGWRMLIDSVEQYAKPLTSIYSDSVSEESLNARKPY